MMQYKLLLCAHGTTYTIRWIFYKLDIIAIFLPIMAQRNKKGVKQARLKGGWLSECIFAEIQQR
jgi:hypothetical protein